MATQDKANKDSNAATRKAEAVEETVEQLQAAKEHLQDAASAGCEAAAGVRSAATAEMDELLDKGRDALCQAQGMIRQHPVAAFGVAFAAGWLLARLTRR